MGGQYGSDVLYLLPRLSRSQVWEIGMRRLRMVDVPNGTSPNRPTIAFDCNNVIYCYGKKSDPVAALANFLDEWASHGFIVIPLVDGKTPVAKQAPIDHIAKRKKNKA